MIRGLAIFLLFVIQLPLFNKWGSVAYYQMNREYIAKNLCENRDKPKMNCNGQCYLAKQLRAAEEKEQKSNSERLEKTPQLDLTFQGLDPDFQFTNAFFFEHICHHFTYGQLIPNSSEMGFFHPPQV